MKFPESWLRQHVQTDAGHDALSACLTAIGLEVEDDAPIGAALTGVVVAEILSLEKHPEADRLNVCQVATGSGTVQIVCGAPNARAGLKAPLAQIGAELPGGFAIKAAKLRGIDSAGMLCSAKELGIDADASGLLELPADAPVGTALADYLGLPDARFELKLTPNRADCFSIRGIAFDLAAALQTRVVPMQIPEVPVASDSRIAVSVAADKDCPRYCGRVIEGLNPKAVTPLWMSEALKRSGFAVERFKTGNPCRLYGRSIDFSRCERQDGDEPPPKFSFMADTIARGPDDLRRQPPAKPIAATSVPLTTRLAPYRPTASPSCCKRVAHRAASRAGASASALQIRPDAAGDIAESPAVAIPAPAAPESVETPGTASPVNEAGRPGANHPSTACGASIRAATATRPNASPRPSTTRATRCWLAATCAALPRSVVDCQRPLLPRTEYRSSTREPKVVLPLAS